MIPEARDILDAIDKLQGEPFVGVKELMQRYGPPRTWWYTLAENGTIPSYKLGKYRKFKFSEIEAWVQKHKQGG